LWRRYKWLFVQEAGGSYVPTLQSVVLILDAFCLLTLDPHKF
jgi:hypothetical protein